MKNLIIISMLILSAITVRAVNTGFDVGTGILTKEVVTVDSLDFPVYITAKGAKYVISVSIIGRKYPIWIGIKSDDMFGDRPIYVTKNKKYWFYKLNKKGYPYSLSLTKNK